METPFTPLLDPGKEVYDNPSFMNAPSDIAVSRGMMPQEKSKSNKYNPVVAPVATSIEADLKAEGSGTSTLSTILAWVGAAKGDFRGLAQIEESKKRTALAKSIVPEMDRVNKLTNEGKWEEAAEYVNKLVGSYGSRADYLVPYFTAMQADIKRKHEGWSNLVGLHKMMGESGASDPASPQHSAYKALTAAIKDKNFVSETNLQGFMTRAKPETQVIDRRKYTTDVLTGKTQTENFPTIFNGSDFDNFAGIAVAASNSLNTKQLADLHNGLSVKTDSGETIDPNSERAQKIKAQFNLAQPINAQLEMAKLVGLPPEASIQLLKDNGLLNVATRNLPAGAIEKGLTGVREQETAKKVAEIKGVEAEKTIPFGEAVVLHGDESNPDTFLTVKTDATTENEVSASKGKLIKVSPSMAPVLQQNQVAINSLDTTREMLNKGTKLQTTGEKWTAGALQKLSSYLGYPIGTNTEARQAIKAILNTAIEQMENTALVSPGIIRGGDRSDIADLKAYASGDFKSEKEVLAAVEKARGRLSNMTKMLIGKTPPVTQSQEGKREKTPAEILAPAIEKGQKGKRPTQSQITRDPYGPGGIQIPADIEEGIKRAVLATGKAAQESGKPNGGAVRVEVPTSGKGQPTLTESPQQGYSEEDEIAKSSAQKKLQRMQQRVR
jgi:hypothetical protein